MKVVKKGKYFISVSGNTYSIKDQLKELGFHRESRQWIIDQDDGIRSTPISERIIKRVEKLTNSKLESVE